MALNGGKQRASFGMPACYSRSLDNSQLVVRGLLVGPAYCWNGDRTGGNCEHRFLVFPVFGPVAFGSGTLSGAPPCSKKKPWTRDLARSQERIAELGTEAEKLKAQAEVDRLARVKIEQRIADRVIDSADATVIV